MCQALDLTLKPTLKMYIYIWLVFSGIFWWGEIPNLPSFKIDMKIKRDFCLWKHLEDNPFVCKHLPTLY